MRWLVIVAMVVCAARVAEANDNHLVVDRAELEPAKYVGYHIRVFTSAVALGGELLDLEEPGDLHAFVDGVELERPPTFDRYWAIRYKLPLELVIVVEVAAAYRH